LLTTTEVDYILRSHVVALTSHYHVAAFRVHDLKPAEVTYVL
jgi:hypothetical protein